MAIISVVLLGLFLAALIGVALLLARRTKERRPDAPATAYVASTGAPLPEVFDRADLPFGAFHQEIALTTFRLLPVSVGPSPLGGRQWTFRYEVTVRVRGVSRSYLSCALVEVPTSWPHLGVERRDTGANVGIPNLPEVVLAGDRPFARRFVVRSDDERFTSSFVGPEVRRWLLDNPGLAFLEVNAGYLVVVFDTDVGDDLLPRLLTWANQLLERTPLAIWPGGDRRVDPRSS